MSRAWGGKGGGGIRRGELRFIKTANLKIFTTFLKGFYLGRLKRGETPLFLFSESDQ
jgi:hypothetical protein